MRITEERVQQQHVVEHMVVDSTATADLMKEDEEEDDEIR